MPYLIDTQGYDLYVDVDPCRQGLFIIVSITGAKRFLTPIILKEIMFLCVVSICVNSSSYIITLKKSLHKMAHLEKE